MSLEKQNKNERMKSHEYWITTKYAADTIKKGTTKGLVVWGNYCAPANHGARQLALWWAVAVVRSISLSKVSKILLIET